MASSIDKLLKVVCENRNIHHQSCSFCKGFFFFPLLESWLPNTLEENHGISHFCLVKLIKQFLAILQTSGRSAFVISERIKSAVKICLMQSDAKLQKKVLCKHSGWCCFHHELVLFTLLSSALRLSGWPVRSSIYFILFFTFGFSSFWKCHPFLSFHPFWISNPQSKDCTYFSFSFFPIFLQGPKSTHTNSD